jgi:hypothetical protein
MTVDLLVGMMTVICSQMLNEKWVCQMSMKNANNGVAVNSRQLR